MYTLGIYLHLYLLIILLLIIKRGNNFMENQTQKTVKEPISRDSIFKIMLVTSFAALVLFFLKAVLGKDMSGAAFIGGTLLIYTLIITIMKKSGVSADKQQLTVSIVIMLLIFFISLNSGAYYSDDYLLYLASYGLTGLYLIPSFTRVQIVIGDILFIIQFLLHPEKVESTGQFIMCMLCFNLAGTMILLLIQRGRAYIEQNELRVLEAEKLLEAMKGISTELQHNFESSTAKMNSINNASIQLNTNANELKKGSQNITNEAKVVYDSCEDVRTRMKLTEDQVDELNNEMRKFETILSENKQHMKVMNTQMDTVKNTISETNKVFLLLNEQMSKITDVTDQLTSISSSTTMLALNASIEAARAGTAGAGFAVVASKVQELAIDSNKCAAEVVSVIESMKNQISKTSDQLGGSTESINNSIVTLGDLQGCFNQLGTQFTSLYSNIEVQNSNINEVNSIFAQLEDKISYMSNYSQDNQVSVQSIADTMQIYKDNISAVMEDTMQLHELSEALMDIASKKGN